jgi:hypothetical protein
LPRRIFFPLGDCILFPASDFQELIRLNKFRELQGSSRVTSSGLQGNQLGLQGNQLGAPG